MSHIRKSPNGGKRYVHEIKKTLLPVLFNQNKIIHIQAILPIETMNSAYFIHFLRKAGDKWDSLRSDPTHLNKLVLQFDSTRPHVANKTKEFLSNKCVETFWKPLYSPD